MKTVHVRTCQECGNEQIVKEPPTDAKALDRWLYNLKCKSCHSEQCFDYGSAEAVCVSGGLCKRMHNCHCDNCKAYAEHWQRIEAESILDDEL